MIRVGIIGGGPGGLMTAHLLERKFGTPCQVTLLEATHRLGGKVRTARFDAAPVFYEAGVAECYAYDAIGHDPLRQLIGELGLTTVATHSNAVVLNGALLRDDEDILRHCGARTLRAIEDARRQAAALLPLESWYRGFTPRDNAHPWARRTCEEILDQIADPVARRYLKIAAHSDMATEPHQTGGLIGLRNILKSVTGYGAQYTIEGGMEMFPRRLAASLAGTRIELDASVVRVSRNADESYSLRFRRHRSLVQQDFDAIVVALPYNRLLEIEWDGERLRRAMTKHVACYDSPGHYLRISILFDRPFWRRLMTGSWVMLDAFGGCCVYDESPSHGADNYGVLGWLLAGADALSLCNVGDRTLIARAIESLPDELYSEARAQFIEGQVHRWAGAVSGQPGGFPLRDPWLAHQPESVEHPALVVVGDYLFDSTLNGVLRSAHIATDCIAAQLMHSPARDLIA
jgi:monoamine oxidase